MRCAGFPVPLSLVDDDAGAAETISMGHSKGNPATHRTAKRTIHTEELALSDQPYRGQLRLRTAGDYAEGQLRCAASLLGFAPGFSLRRRPNFLVLVVHRVATLSGDNRHDRERCLRFATACHETSLAQSVCRLRSFRRDRRTRAPHSVGQCCGAIFSRADGFRRHRIFSRRRVAVHE